MLAGALLGNVSKFAVALEQVRKQKEAGVEPEVKEEKAEEPKQEEAKTEVAEENKEEATTEA